MHKGVELIHQRHVVRRGHLRAVDQRGDGFARHFRPGDAREEIPVLLRHLAGKPREGLLQQRLHAVEIVGHRPQRHARAGGDFTVRDGVNTVFSNGVERRLQDLLPAMRIVGWSAHQFLTWFVYKCTQTC